MGRRPAPIVFRGKPKESLGEGLAGLGKLFEGIAGIKTGMQEKERRESLVQQAVDAGMNEDVARGRDKDALAKFLIGEGEREKKLERSTDFLSRLVPKKTTTTPVTPSEQGREATPDIKITDLSKPIGPIAEPLGEEVTEAPSVDRETLKSTIGLVQEGILPASDLKKLTGLEGTFKQPTTGDTDVERFAQDAEIVYKDLNPNATPAELAKVRNDSRLIIKRAQAQEVAANRLAFRLVDAKTEQIIAFNGEMGTRLATIATAADLIKAKGELTPVQKKAEGKRKLSGNLATLANHFIKLDSMDAIVNSDKSTFDNIFAFAASSKVGQFFGKAVGTEEQSVRNSIETVRPALINFVRQTTDMGAKGMDSEKELEFYMKTVTDTQTDIQSNIAAIVSLDQSYGDGKITEAIKGFIDKNPELQTLIARVSEEGKAIKVKDLQDKGLLDKNGILTPEAQKRMADLILLQAK